MSSNVPRVLREITLEKYAHQYLLSLPPEHFMEAIDQATQRKITLESLDLVQAKRPDIKVFNELLGQYPLKGQRKPGQVVPDNMVVLTSEKVHASGSYNVSLEPAPPFWVLEYVSTNNPRKDYEESFRKYERELKVPYYLVYYPETQDLSLYRHNKRGYTTVKPNEHGRYPIKAIDIEVGLIDGWVRYWYKGELLPLPGDLQQKLEIANRQAEEARKQAQAEKQRADLLQQRLADMERELAALRNKSGKK